MNAARRKQIDAVAALLSKLSEQLAEAVELITEIRDEEQEYFDNMPESLQGGDKGSAAEEAVSNLESALEALESLDLDSVVSDLESAKCS